MLAQVCTDCHQTLPMSSFYRNRSARNGHANICKDCSRIRSRDCHVKIIKENSVAFNSAVDNLLVNQNYSCLLCHRTEADLHAELLVDVSASDLPFALLCHSCAGTVNSLRAQDIPSVREYIERRDST